MKHIKRIFLLFLFYMIMAIGYIFLGSYRLSEYIFGKEFLLTRFLGRCGDFCFQLTWALSG